MKFLSVLVWAELYSAGANAGVMVKVSYPVPNAAVPMSQENSQLFSVFNRVDRNPLGA